MGLLDTIKKMFGLGGGEATETSKEAEAENKEEQPGKPAEETNTGEQNQSDVE